MNEIPPSTGEPDAEVNAAPQPFKSGVQFLAFGMGSGLSPKAPGTAGTLAAIPLYLLLAQLPLWQYSVAVLLLLLAGIYI